MEIPDIYKPSRKLALVASYSTAITIAIGILVCFIFSQLGMGALNVQNYKIGGVQAYTFNVLDSGIAAIDPNTGSVTLTGCNVDQAAQALWGIINNIKNNSGVKIQNNFVIPCGSGVINISVVDGKVKWVGCNPPADSKLFWDAVVINFTF
jgi:hypothetical protein